MKLVILQGAISDLRPIPGMLSPTDIPSGQNRLNFEFWKTCICVRMYVYVYICIYTHPKSLRVINSAAKYFCVFWFQNPYIQ